MTDKVKVKYVSIILISCQQTKPLRIPKRYVKLLVLVPITKDGIIGDV